MSPGELYLNTLCFLIRGYDDRDLGTQRLMLLQPRVVTLDIVQYDPIGLSAATLPLLRKVTSVCVVTLKISASDRVPILSILLFQIVLLQCSGSTMELTLRGLSLINALIIMWVYTVQRAGVYSILQTQM